MKRGGKLNIFAKIKNFFRKKIPIIFGGGQSNSRTLQQTEIVGSIAHCVGKHISKLVPQTIRETNGTTTILNTPLSRLLTIRPCPECSTSNLLYKFGSGLIYGSNVFAVIFYDDDFLNIVRIQPVGVETFEIFESTDGRIYFEFIWSYDHQTYTLPYSQVIHIKDRFTKNRFLGTDPYSEINTSIDMLDATYKGVKRVSKNSPLQGYLKYNNLADEDVLKEKVKEFQEAYLNAENSGGLAALDNTFNFVELKNQLNPIPTDQIALFQNNIYRYYGISEPILTGRYTEEEWNAFFESVIEPIAIQLSEEFTYKVFTEREIGFGNRIVFTADRLQCASLNTRLNIGKELFDRGIITINEYRQLMYKPAIDGGDIRQISLNYVNTANQDKYQVGEGGEKQDGTRADNQVTDV